MSNSKLKNTVIMSLIWKLLERGGTQGIQFIVQIVLARLLLPEDYGMIAIVTIFISFANVFVQTGFNTALIQKKEIDDTDLSTVFYINMIVSLIIYLIIFISAPWIASFYNMSQLTEVLRVLSLTLFTGSFNSIQNAIISRTMEFKKLFSSSLGAVFISGFLGIMFAYMGAGVWALVIQQLSSNLTLTVILWFSIKWSPKSLFSLKKAKTLFGFGWKILVTSIIDNAYTNLRSLVIGAIYLPSTLGYYNRGKQFPALIITNINGAIQSVMLPALSSQQDNRKRVKEMMRRSIVTSSFIVFPMLIGLMIISETLILVLLTEKWLPAVPFLQIYCLSYLLFPIHTSNLQAINAVGRSDIFLKLEVVKKFIGILILIISIKYGVYAIAFGELISGILSTFINAYPNKKLLNYGYLEQIKDIFPSVVLSTVMGVAVFFVGYLSLNPLLVLLIQVFVGFITYVGLARIVKLDSYEYLKNTILDLVKIKKMNKTESLS